MGIIQPKDPSKSFYEMKRQVAMAMKRLLLRDGQFDVKRTVSYLCLETGLGEKTVNKILSDLLVSGELVIEGSLAKSTRGV